MQLERRAAVRRLELSIGKELGPPSVAGDTQAFKYAPKHSQIVRVQTNRSHLQLLYLSWRCGEVAKLSTQPSRLKRVRKTARMPS